MSDSTFMRSCAEAVVRDVAATTSLSVELSLYTDPDNGIGAVVHETGTHPAAPVWDALGYLNGGDSLAIHAPSRPTALSPDNGSRTEGTRDIAFAAQDLVQMLLWGQGLGPNLAGESGTRSTPPLRAGKIGPHTSSDGTSLLGETDSAAQWECPEGTTTIPIGSLHPPQA